MSVEQTERDRFLYELPTNVVVAAGAGTGKTHRLSGLYLHLVAGLTDVPRRDGSPGPLAPEEIVATTFTREAAAEMRSRIEARLRKLVSASLDELVVQGGEPAVWADELLRTCNRRGVTPPSREVFRRALESLPRGTISTFHAWAGELVRAHPIEARVPPGFALLEPEDSDALLGRAMRDVLDAWLADPREVTAGLRRDEVARRLLHSGVEVLETNVRAALLRLAEEGVDAEHLRLADGEGEAERAARRLDALLDELAHLADQRPPESRARKDGSDLRALVHEARGLALRWRETGDRLVAEEFGAAFKRISNQRGVKEVYEPYLQGSGTIPVKATSLLVEAERTREAARLAEATRVLLTEIQAAVALAKRRARALDFGDVLRRARDLLAFDPEVQAEVAGEVRALLVDEFQDTNALQRDLVYLVRQRPDGIARRALGAIPDPDTLAPSGLFLVGDRKQSIYSFRGADVAVFQRIALDLAGEEARALLGNGPLDGPVGATNGRVITLAENRRSVDEVLHFVNALAAVDMRGHDQLSVVEQVVFQPALEDLLPVRTSGRPEGAPVARVIVPTVVPPAAGEAAAEASGDLLAALAIAAEIRALLENPGQAELEGPLRRRDIAVLLRTYAPLSSLEFAFALHGVEYAVASGRGLFATGEAADLDALARLLVDRGDRHALLAVLRGPFVSLSDRALLSLAGDKGLELPGDLAASQLDAGERARVQALLDVLEETRTQGARLGAAALLRRAIVALGYEETLAMLPSGEARLRDLRRLLEHAERFPTGLASFSRWLTRGREGELDEARGAVFDDEHDAVRILTIHASKGLEFRVVFATQVDHVGPRSIIGPLLVARGQGGLSLATKVAFLDQREFGLGGRTLHDRALAGDRAERQRLTYVALTRARDLLYAVARPSSRAQPDDASAARSIGRLLDQRPGLAVRKDLRPLLDPPAEPESAEPIARAVPAYGEGEFQVGSGGSTVVTTALAEFAFCARRFRLLHVVGLPEHAPRARPLAELSEPVPDDEELEGEPVTKLVETIAVEEPVLPVGPLPNDPRAQGILAHLALERVDYASAVGERAVSYAESFLRGQGYDPADEASAKVVARIVRFLRSSFAGSLADPSVRVERERPFVVELPSGIALRGTIDLVVVRRLEGRTRVEVVDYKSGKGGPSAVSHYELQLRAYAAACTRGAIGPLPEGPVEVVAGIAFLGGGSGEPIWLSDPAGLASPSNVQHIDRVARRLLDARASGQWPGIEKPGCIAVRCGFFPLCHPERP
ncbi:MAG: UvrD-helicase domain-containing protein [Sandaracinaceae bacterium]|nr:UvrD-helicase domain-containing protein [Sandaracinaceae bacterium]